MALWIVATPIGTLDDLSPRARDILGKAAVIAAEDTRTTRRLLTAVGVPAPPLVAVHAHNEDAIGEEIARRALTEEVALVCDAGTPGISDPGGAVVSAAHRLGVEIRSVPGPSALASALAASGLPAAPSVFLGFPPRKGLAGWARAALSRPETLVMYEAGNRVVDLVSALAVAVPGREACLCREISKKFEEIRRMPLRALADELAARDEIRGECVLVVGPGETPVVEVSAPVVEGAGLGDVADALAARWGVQRRKVYQGLLALEREVS